MTQNGPYSRFNNGFPIVLQPSAVYKKNHTPEACLNLCVWSIAQQLLNFLFVFLIFYVFTFPCEYTNSRCLVLLTLGAEGGVTMVTCVCKHFMSPAWWPVWLPVPHLQLFVSSHSHIHTNTYNTYTCKHVCHMSEHKHPPRRWKYWFQRSWSQAQFCGNQTAKWHTVQRNTLLDQSHSNLTTNANYH